MLLKCIVIVVMVTCQHCKQVSLKLRSNVHAVGDATTDVLYCAANAQVAPDNAQAIRGLNYASKVLAETVVLYAHCILIMFLDTC